MGRFDGERGSHVKSDHLERNRYRPREKKVGVLDRAETIEHDDRQECGGRLIKDGAKIIAARKANDLPRDDLDRTSRCRANVLRNKTAEDEKVDRYQQQRNRNRPRRKNALCGKRRGKENEQTNFRDGIDRVFHGNPNRLAQPSERAVLEGKD